MAAEAYRSEFGLPSEAIVADGVNYGFGSAARILVYVISFISYLLVLIVALSTLGLIEIRQDNLNDSNSLIAILDQSERYASDGYFKNTIAHVSQDIEQYRHLKEPPPCAVDAAPDAKQANSLGASGVSSTVDPNSQSAHPQSCADVTAIGDQKFYGLLSLQYDLLFKQANLPIYYNAYVDGIRQKSPQLIPLLQFMDSPIPIVHDWARLPFEILEMLLLVFMGALGGVISIARCFVDPSIPNPMLRDFCYRPIAGAVVALGIYILFRAMQMFFGGVGQNTVDTVSTSVFILAALGLASGVCAREAIAQLEFLAKRILRRTENAQSDDGADFRDAGGAEKSEAAVSDPHERASRFG
jgi:hypothetical protein